MVEKKIGNRGRVESYGLTPACSSSVGLSLQCADQEIMNTFLVLHVALTTAIAEEGPLPTPFSGAVLLGFGDPGFQQQPGHADHREST